MRISYFLLSLFVVIVACYPDSNVATDSNLEIDTKAYINVDERLWPHFYQFEQEARGRGIIADLNRANISGVIRAIYEDGVVGTCSYGGRQRSADVVIDTRFWERASVIYREYLVFHELGHCFLFRNHLDACRYDGIWASIMRSGTRDHCRDDYNHQTREYYLDELFGVE